MTLPMLGAGIIAFLVGFVRFLAGFENSSISAGAPVAPKGSLTDYLGMLYILAIGLGRENSVKALGN